MKKLIIERRAPEVLGFVRKDWLSSGPYISIERHLGELPVEAEHFNQLIERMCSPHENLTRRITIERGLYTAQKSRTVFAKPLHTYMIYDCLPPLFYYQKFDYDENFQESVKSQLDSENLIYCGNYNILHFEKNTVYQTPVAKTVQERTTVIVEYDLK